MVERKLTPYATVVGLTLPHTSVIAYSHVEKKKHSSHTQVPMKLTQGYGYNIQNTSSHTQSVHQKTFNWKYAGENLSIEIFVLSVFNVALFVIL